MLKAFGKPMIMISPCSNRASRCTNICSDKTILPGPASNFKTTGPGLSLPVSSSNTAVLCMFGYKGTITVLMHSFNYGSLRTYSIKAVESQYELGNQTFMILLLEVQQAIQPSPEKCHLTLPTNRKYRMTVRLILLLLLRMLLSHALLT
jgi:hypothetical protein